MISVSGHPRKDWSQRPSLSRKGDMLCASAGFSNLLGVRSDLWQLCQTWSSVYLYTYSHSVKESVLFFFYVVSRKMSGFLYCLLTYVVPTKVSDMSLYTCSCDVKKCHTFFSFIVYSCSVKESVQHFPQHTYIVPRKVSGIFPVCLLI